MKSKSNAWSLPVPPAIVSASSTPTPLGQSHHEKHHRHDEHQDGQPHGLDVGPGDGLHAAEHRVDDGRNENQERRHRDAPSENHRQHDSRRGRNRAARHAAREQEQETRESARLQVEPPLEVLVRRVDLRAIEERHERDAEDDHRERQAVVELHEAQAVVVALPVVPTSVTALSCVAMTDSPTAHHGMDRFARKYDSVVRSSFVRLMPSETSQAM